MNGNGDHGITYQFGYIMYVCEMYVFGETGLWVVIICLVVVVGIVVVGAGGAKTKSKVLTDAYDIVLCSFFTLSLDTSSLQIHTTDTYELIKQV